MSNSVSFIYLNIDIKFLYTIFAICTAIAIMFYLYYNNLIKIFIISILAIFIYSNFYWLSYIGIFSILTLSLYILIGDWLNFWLRSFGDMVFFILMALIFTFTYNNFDVNKYLFYLYCFVFVFFIIWYISFLIFMTYKRIVGQKFDVEVTKYGIWKTYSSRPYPDPNDPNNKNKNKNRRKVYEKRAFWVFTVLGGAIAGSGRMAVTKRWFTVFAGYEEYDEDEYDNKHIPEDPDKQDATVAVVWFITFLILAHYFIYTYYPEYWLPAYNEALERARQAAEEVARSTPIPEDPFWYQRLHLKDVFTNEHIRELTPTQREDWEFMLKAFTVDDHAYMCGIAQLMSDIKDITITPDSTPKDCEVFFKELIRLYKDFLKHHPIPNRTVPLKY